MVRVVREFQQGFYDEEISSLSNYTQNVRFALMQGIIQAHKTPMSDVLEYRKNRKEFTEKLQNHKYKFFNHRIYNY